MQHHRLLCFPLALVLGCIPADDDTCTTEQPVDGRVNGLPLADAPVREDLELRGWTSQAAGAAIHDIYVVVGDDGFRIPVAPDEDDGFEQWSVVVPSTVLDAASDDDGEVSVSVEAFDGCGNTSEIIARTLTIDPSAGLESLTLEAPSLPIPANGSVPAEVRVVANAEAIGAEVVLSAEGVRFGQGDQASRIVVLAADPSDAMIASATILVRGTEAGIAAITAEANAKTTRAEVHVAGPPLLAPTTATLGLAQSVTLSVYFGACVGATTTCRASNNPDVTVESGATDLELAPAGVDGDGDGRIDVVVTVDDDVTEDSIVTIVCTDAFEQVGSATLAIVAPV